MLDFDLTEEQRLLEQSVREWGAREIAPKIRELDRKRTKQAGFDHHLVKPIDLTSLETLLTTAPD